MGSSEVVLIRFGVFEADVRGGELRRNGTKVRLQDLPFRALTLLLSRPGIVITREEFRQALWHPDVFVDFEQGISSAMMRLRDALGDSADNPIFIETVERRGYRWIAPIHSAKTAEPEKPFLETILPELPQAPTPQPSRHSPSRSLLFAVPLLILFALWLMWPGNRGFKTRAASTAPSVPVRPRSASREAEDYYLKGRFYWNKRTPGSLNQAVVAFNQAIARDPNYADAYVGLSDCYNLLREFSVMPANEAYFKAFAAAKKAVELDPQSSEAHTSLAFVTFWGMWDVPDAEVEFRRAIALDPNNVKAHHWFATFLQAITRSDEALAEIELARKLDPHSSAIIADQGEILRVAGRPEQAERLLKQLEAAEPDFVLPHRYLRLLYFDTLDYPDYLAELKKEAILTHNGAKLSEAEAAAKGFAEGGAQGLLAAQLAEQKKLYKQGKASPYFVAQTEARLGNSAEMLKYLTICVQSHNEYALDLNIDQTFTRFHGDPAFQRLVAEIGLPPARQ
jgi:DNA-binding winged helix-turn-helix (wHTH) protein/Tfp pilus assembly protein PilF